MGVFNLEEDILNRAMLDGLICAVRDELKKFLMDAAEREVDIVVDKVCQKVKLKIDQGQSGCPQLGDKYIRLSWLIQKG